ncbi:MAG TPA: HAD family hydrolase [Rhodanobacteraceae bacterium]|nr:HAD family hydrolase [Rhodanobacteraceae bacterium]
MSPKLTARGLTSDCSGQAAAQPAAAPGAGRQVEVLALFDFDGTITTHETMPVFLRRSTSRRRKTFGAVLFVPLVVGYKAGLISGTTIRRLLVRFAYRGVPSEALAMAGSAFARGYLAGVLRPEAVSRIAWHKSQGHRVVVVSGGLDVYLRPWCEAQGLELLCSSLQQRGGILTGRFRGKQCVLAEKAHAVRKHYNLASHGTIYAYGDTHEDEHLLSLATKSYYRWEEVGARDGC